MAQRIQFGLRNVLWATFWVSVSCTAFYVLSGPDLRIPNKSALAVEFSLIFVGLWAPLVAIGALLGHTVRYMAVGGLFIALLLVLIWPHPATWTLLALVAVASLLMFRDLA